MREYSEKCSRLQPQQGPHCKDKRYWRLQTESTRRRSNVAEELIRSCRDLSKRTTILASPIQGAKDRFGDEVLSRGASHSTGSEKAFVNLGVALQEKGDLKRLANAYEKALQAKPDLTTALWNMAIVADQQGDAEDAAILYSEAISKKPDWDEAWFRLGYWQLQQQDYGSSIEAFDNCVGASPIGLKRSSISQSRTGERESKRLRERLWRRRIHHSQNRLEILRALTSLTIEMNDLDKAVAYQAKLDQLGDRSPELSYNLGVALQSPRGPKTRRKLTLRRCRRIQTSLKPI